MPAAENGDSGPLAAKLYFEINSINLPRRLRMMAANSASEAEWSSHAKGSNVMAVWPLSKRRRVNPKAGVGYPNMAENPCDTAVIGRVANVPRTHMRTGHRRTSPPPAFGPCDWCGGSNDGRRARSYGSCG